MRRVCRFYGASPRFICCSATIANPGQHAEQLTALPFTVIADDGSPSGARDFVLWNPPFVDPAKTARRSANSEATTLFVELVQTGLRNITFTKARKVAELILLYAREVLEIRALRLIPLIRAYRAGYLAEERREIERAPLLRSSLSHGGRKTGPLETVGKNWWVDQEHSKYCEYVPH